jgi:hypothetical protein
MVYKIETPSGVLQAAMDYVMASLSWSGTRYRIIRTKKVAA